jgi:hypothetical protein
MTKHKNAEGKRIITMPARTKPKLKAVGGSNYDLVNNTLAWQAVNGLWLPASLSEDDRHRLITAAITTMKGIKPRDQVEGMIAAQMIATHNAAMECFRRAMGENQPPELREQNLKFANKLIRSHATLVETLDRHRGKREQKVTVEHVHVHEGGQAIVGNVTGRGRGAQKLKEQPHAQGAALPSPDATMPRTLKTNKTAVSKPCH